MKIITLPAISICLLFAITSCRNTTGDHKEKADTLSSKSEPAKGTYGYDASFLKAHNNKVLELESNDGTSKILLSADYQGRVMTSTAGGDNGLSFGWMNYDLVAAPGKRKQFNPVGGEERFWLGPEGGQFALYFKQDDPFNMDHWKVPAVIDTERYDVVLSNATEAIFSKQTSIINYTGTVFDIDITRKITMLNKTGVESMLHIALPADVKFVGYQTENALRNAGTEDWTKENGLLSIWLLGMFAPGAKTMVIIPLAPMENARSFITDNYFGSIPPERLQVTDSALYFVCDGKYRSKVGVSPKIAKPMAASFDFQNNTLTILLPEIDKQADYVNSKWEQQTEPYKGDVINAYNDGPLADGTQMGPFYEIESSSPALALKQGEAATYKQTTLHLQGTYNLLRQLAIQILGVDIDTIKK